MAYEVTATRKRPQDFDHLVGQEFVVSTLKNSLKSGMIAHAYLFAGPRGVGKTSTARVLAKALNCPDGPGSENSFNWQGADEIAKGRSIDVIEIDGASNTSVNDIRAIKDEVLFPPQSSRYKIYIIDEVHMLSNSAFNALLKTIEEPPPYIIFIFATTELHKVPATIRSRCQQFVFKLIPLDVVKERLAEAAQDLDVKADEEALTWIAKESTGSMRDAYTLFDQVVAFSQGQISIEKIREKLGLVGLDQLNEIAGLIMEEKTSGLIEYFHKILGNGVSVEQLVMDMTEYFRGLLLLKSGVTRETLLGYSAARFNEAAVIGLTRTQSERILFLLLQAYRDLRYSLDPRYDTELLLCRLARIRRYMEPEDVLLKLEKAGSMSTLADQEKVPIHTEVPLNAMSQKTQDMVEPPKPLYQKPVVDIEKVTIQKLPENPARIESVPEATEQVGELSIDHKRALMNAVREQSLAMAGYFDHVSVWDKQGGTLILKCVNNFATRSLLDERKNLLAICSKVLPFIKDIQIVAVNDAKEKQAAIKEELNPEAEKVRDIFRGEYT